MQNFCTNCGKQIPESGVCVCVETQAAKPEIPVNTAEPATQPTPAPIGVTQPNMEFDKVKQQSLNVVSSCMNFLKKFFKAPVATIEEHTLGLPETIIFIVLQFLGLFATGFWVIFRFRLRLGSFSSVFNMSLRRNFFRIGSSFPGMFARAFFVSIIGFALLAGISIFFGHIVFKGKLDMKKLVSSVAMANVPLTLMVIVASVFAVVWPGSIILPLALGVTSSAILGTFAFMKSFDLSLDKAVYTAIFTYTIQAWIVYGMIGRTLISLI
ncbi:MAG: hypothetical protein FWD82_03355 [Defluviitaleaceae bacterium]|nr:hypothetical protein [Defluviitaleaceae bacterium]